MSKDRIVSAIFEQADLKSKKQAGLAYEALISSVQEALSEGETVNLTTFGSFSITVRKARTGVNPKTGEQIDIPETKAVQFTPGKALKNMDDAPTGSEKAAEAPKAAAPAETAKEEAEAKSKQKPKEKSKAEITEEITEEAADQSGLLSIKGFMKSMEHTVKDLSWPKITSEVKREIEDIEAKGKISKAVSKVTGTVDEAAGKLKNVGGNGGEALKEIGGGFGRAFKEIKTSVKNAVKKF
jgi:DNA-binding protein HU-beta